MKKIIQIPSLTGLCCLLPTTSHDAVQHTYDFALCRLTFAVLLTQGHTGTVYAICFVPGELVAEAKLKLIKQKGDDEDGNAENGNAKNGEGEELDLEDPERVPEKRDDDGIHPEDIIITGSGDGTARAWEMATGKLIRVGATTTRHQHRAQSVRMNGIK